VKSGTDDEAADVICGTDPSSALLRALENSPLVPPHDRLLHCAAVRGLDQAVKELLRLGLNADSLDSWRNTALHCAARAGYLDVARELVHGSADVNLRDDRGRYAFELAENFGHHALAAWLLKRTYPSGMSEFEKSSLLRRLQGKRERNTDKPKSESDHDSSTSPEVERLMKKYVWKKRRTTSFPVDFEKYLEHSSEAIREAEMGVASDDAHTDSSQYNETNVILNQGQRKHQNRHVLALR
jgi:hypothetical protein